MPLDAWVPMGYQPDSVASKDQGNYSAVRTQGVDMINSALANGSITPDVAGAVSGALSSAGFESSLTGDMEEMVGTMSTQLAQSFNKLNGENNETSSPAIGSQGFTERALDFMGESEGFVPFAYDDARRSRRPVPWKDSKKRGDPTIGFGFKLSRKDAREKLRAVGLDYDKIMRGEQSINKQTAARLFNLDWREITARLRKEFPNIEWTEHRLLGVGSMIYHGGYDGMIGPKIREALKAGDMKAVEREIRHNSIDEAGMHKKGSGWMIPSFQLRRHKEADSWIGVGNEAPLS